MGDDLVAQYKKRVEQEEAHEIEKTRQAQLSREAAQQQQAVGLFVHVVCVVCCVVYCLCVCVCACVCVLFLCAINASDLLSF